MHNYTGTKVHVVCRMSDTPLLVHRYLCVVHIINFVCSLHLIFMHIIHSHLTIHWICICIFSRLLTLPCLTSAYLTGAYLVQFTLSVFSQFVVISVWSEYIFCIWYFVANYMHRDRIQFTGQMNSWLFGKSLYWICILFRHFLLGACTYFPATSLQKKLHTSLYCTLFCILTYI